MNRPCVMAAALLMNCLHANDMIHVADFRRFLADPQMRTIVRATVSIIGKSSGFGASGIFISPYHVITDEHVTKAIRCNDMKITTMVRTGGGGLDGRQVGCKDFLFEDEEKDIALIETDKPWTDYIALGNSSQISAGAMVEVTGYLRSNYFVHSYQCPIVAERGENKQFPTSNGSIMNGKDFFVIRCVSDQGISGGATYIREHGVPYLLGTLKGESGHGGGDVGMLVSISRLPDAMEKYKKEFEGVQRVLDSVRGGKT